MSRLRFGGLIVLGLVLCVIARPGGADEPKANESAKRLIYLTRSLPPADLAKALNAHFKQEVEAIAVADKTSNAILLNVSSNAYDELLKTLEVIDPRPASIEVEVTVAELRSDGKEGPAKIEEEALSGPTEQVAAKLREMKKAGLVTTLRHFKLSALENQRATLRMGESRPYVIGSSVSSRGISTGSINYRDLGTTLSLKPRLVGSDCVVELELEDSGMVGESGTSPGTDDNGKPLPGSAPTFGNSRLQTTVRVPAGTSLLVKGAKTEAKGLAGTLVLVTARHLDAPTEKK